MKGQGKGQTVFVNGEEKAGSGQIGNFTVYVSPFVVLRSGSYTKHYYIEGQRVVSKLGGGWEGETPGQAGSGKVDYNKKEKQMQEGIVKNLKWLGLDGQILTAGKSGKTPPGQLNGSGGQSNPAEPNRYYYHPDHLGSTSYITDASGEVYQHLEYFAFGETFVEEHSNTDRTPYLYNGKELDEETGLYYYGARYYDAVTSVWVSVDPLAEKYPGLSGYNYVANNPLKYVDPDGKRIRIKYRDEEGKRRRAYYNPEKSIAEDKNGNKVQGEFLDKVVKSLNYTKKADDLELQIISKVAKHKKTVTIKETSGGHSFRKGVNVIKYNPSLATDVTKTLFSEGGPLLSTGKYQSPAMGLFHEIVHSYGFFYEKRMYNQRSRDTNVPDHMTDKEEQHVIQNYEKNVANRLGEPIRNYHDSIDGNITVEDPTDHKNY